MRGDEERCLAAGMDAYVTKPVRIEALAEVLGRVIPVGGQPVVLRELAGLFREDAGEDISTLKQSLAGFDPEAVGRTAHRLRGSCVAIGANRLAKFATQVECRALDGRVDDLDVLVLAIERSLAEVDAALAAELA